MRQIKKKTQKCRICRKNKKNLSGLMEIHSEEKPFKCGDCENKCKKRQVFERHLRTLTKKETFNCELCVEPFTYSFNLTRHYQTQHPGISGHCTNHLRTHTASKPIKLNVDIVKENSNPNKTWIHTRKFIQEKSRSNVKCVVSNSLNLLT